MLVGNNPRSCTALTFVRSAQLRQDRRKSFQHFRRVEVEMMYVAHFEWDVSQSACSCKFTGKM